MIFLYQVRGEPDGVRVVLSGDIDVAVREELRSVLAGVVAVSPGAIDLDLHEVTFLDCSGIGEFVRAYNDAHGRGQTLTVSRPPGIVRRILELTGVLALLAPDAAAVVPTAGRTTVPQLRDLPTPHDQRLPTRAAVRVRRRA